MPFLFLVAGLVMIISAVKGTQGTLLQLLKSDVTGKNNFIYWMLAILGIGAFGYVKELKPLATAMLVLVVVVLFLDSKGVFAQFSAAIGQTQNQTSTPATATNSNTLGSPLANLETLPLGSNDLTSGLGSLA